jgi:hypothetical protein
LRLVEQILAWLFSVEHNIVTKPHAE